MTDIDTDALARLADETLEHLNRERDVLEQICQRATALRAMLLQRDNEAVYAEVVNLEPLQVQARRLGDCRRHLSQAIALRLGLPTQQATVTRLARALPDEHRESLLTVRDELISLTRRANRLHRGNLSIASCFSHFADQLLAALTGRPITTQYAKSGRLETDRPSSLFQTEV